MSTGYKHLPAPVVPTVPPQQLLLGDAEEIGRAAVWLCSDYADYVHGILSSVDQRHV
jgi:hypothetical protein